MRMIPILHRKLLLNNLIFKLCVGIHQIPSPCSPFLSIRPMIYTSRTSGNSTSASVCSVDEISSLNRARISADNVKLNRLGGDGRVKEARKLFDDMPERDTVSYATMITGYLKNHDLLKAEKLFLEMPGEARGVFTNSAMIDGYAKAGRLEDARKVFDEMPQRNVYSWTSMISGYFRNGHVDEAAELFTRMPVKNVVSWTAVVLGYAQNGLIDEARSVFHRMPERNVVAWTVMINAYSGVGGIDEALNLFYEMPYRNVYAWNAIILGCLRNKRVDEAVELFDSMPSRNSISSTVMITGLAENGLRMCAREYFDCMRDKDIAAWNAMITAYANEGLMVEARELFCSMPQKNAVTWTAVVDGYARIGNNVEASRHLILMLRSCTTPTDATITAILACCEVMLEIMEAHALIVKLGFEQYTVPMNALITGYSRIGDLSSANAVFQSLEAKDIVSWKAMILACSSHGHGKCALEAFAQLLRSGSMPDKITFVAILSACCRAGLVEKGLKIFNSMSHGYGLEPTAPHYACLIDILSRAGRLEDAIEEVRRMPTSEQDGTALGALLSASRLHSDIGMANLIGKQVIDREPLSSGGYILLANAYASCGKWDEFARMRKEMRERKISKLPGWSRVEIKGKSRLFFSGDKSHPEMEEIHKCLQDTLLPCMLEMGQTLNNQSV
ncbi:hypothetical protein Nepgr_032433 [Nepenthes gracilis]|uniref:Uncharacterized protein n=1 Tax=Nepenthes gracilis TaxID=150966 RepID=A0AAD3TIK2_NEPGR|nr:hypothetical protein Nepgr_032433 [Nepenthes gracilis]